MESLLTLLANNFHIHRWDLVFDGIPILTSDTKATGEQYNVLGFKRHCFGVAVIEHIDGNITLKQLQSSLLGKREHIGVGIAVSVHRLDRH